MIQKTWDSKGSKEEKRVKNGFHVLFVYFFFLNLLIGTYKPYRDFIHNFLFFHFLLYYFFLLNLSFIISRQTHLIIIIYFYNKWYMQIFNNNTHYMRTYCTVKKILNLRRHKKWSNRFNFFFLSIYYNSATLVGKLL